MRPCLDQPCREPGCSDGTLDRDGNPWPKSAVWGCAADKKKLFCANHAKDGMVMLTSTACRTCRTTNAHFGLPGGKKVACKDCAEPGMINLGHPFCVDCGKIHATYGPPNAKTTGATHCVGCKPETYVNVKSKKCKSCKAPQPNFNYPGTPTPEFCNQCKKVGMINVTKSHCPICLDTDGRFVEVTYGKPGERAKYCAKHGTERGCVDVKNKMCEDCKKIHPNFGLDKSKPATHCSNCKTTAMFPVNGACRHPGCNKFASFGPPGTALGRACAEHGKPLGFIDVVNLKCRGSTIHGICVGTGSRVGAHISAANSQCVACRKADDPDSVTRKHLFRERCFIGTTPAQIEQGDHLAELGYTDGLINTLKRRRLDEQGGYDLDFWINDNRVVAGGEGCSSGTPAPACPDTGPQTKNPRLDSWLVLNNGTFVFEPAENQHRSYVGGFGCELQRIGLMHDILSSGDVDKSTVVMMANTDGYVKDGQSFKSAFTRGTNSSRERRVKDGFFERRMDALAAISHKYIDELQNGDRVEVGRVHVVMVDFDDAKVAEAEAMRRSGEHGHFDLSAHYTLV